MPQLIALALIGAVIWYAWRALQKEMARIGDEMKETVRKKEPQGRFTALEKGEDGVYRPKQDD